MFPQILEEFFHLGYLAVSATTLWHSMNRRQCMESSLFILQSEKVQEDISAASNLWNGFQYVWDASIVLKPKHTSWQVSKVWQPQLFETCCNHIVVGLGALVYLSPSFASEEVFGNTPLCLAQGRVATGYWLVQSFLFCCVLGEMYCRIMANTLVLTVGNKWKGTISLK